MSNDAFKKLHHLDAVSYDCPAEAGFLDRTDPDKTMGEEGDAETDGDADDKAAPIPGSLADVRRLKVEREA